MTKYFPKRLYLKLQLNSFWMVEKFFTVEKLIEFHKIIDDLENNEVNIEDKDKDLSLLRSLRQYFEHFKNALL